MFHRSWRWERGQPWTPCYTGATVGCQCMDSRRASLGGNRSAERPTGMRQASNGSSAAEAIEMVAIFGITTPGPAESLSAGGCMVVLPLKPTRDALASTLKCPPAPILGVIKAPSLHLPRVARSVQASDFGMQPDKDMPLEAQLMAVASARTRASLMVATPGFRLLVEARTDVRQLVAGKASDPRGGFARRGLSYTVDRALVALLLRAEIVVAVGEA